jgi:pyruvate carboxylase subunit B
MANDTVYVRLDNREYEVTFEKNAVTVNGKPIPVELFPTKRKSLLKVRVEDRIFNLPLELTDEGARVLFSGREYLAQFEDQRQRLLRSLGSHSEEGRAVLNVKAPMPGLIVKIETKVGDAVKRGQGIMVVEAMKMENEVRVPSDGTVKEIRVRERQTVEKGEVLVVIE